MTTSSSSTITKVWEFAFDGIEKITPIKGPAGHNQLEIMLSSSEKVNEFFHACDFTQRNGEEARFGLAGPKDHCLTFFGPDVSHTTLLDALQKALASNRAAKTFQYTLIQ